jgi:hypothetical protein
MKKITNYEEARQAMLVLVSRLEGITAEHFIQAVQDALSITFGFDSKGEMNVSCRNDFPVDEKDIRVILLKKELEKLSEIYKKIASLQEG